MRWFIAIRYFFAHKRQSIVCIAGVTISVLMYLAMSSMMQGFSDTFIIETVESSGHITVHDEPRETRTPILEQAYPDPSALRKLDGVKPRDKVERIRNPAGLMAVLRRMPGIEAVAPEVADSATASFGTKTMNINVIGVEPEEHLKVTTIGDNVVQGDFRKLRGVADGIVLGSGVADVLGAAVGDSITLASPTGGRSNSRVVGVFQTGVTPVDYGRAYMLLSSAQTLMDRKNIINAITIRTDDYNKADEYARQIESVSGYKTESWKEANANFLKIFKVQTVITTFITGALLVVAAFGVLNILVMAVLERVNDIAILKSFGLSRTDITVIYLFQGAVIGLIGTALGLGLGKIAIEVMRRLPIQIEGLVKAEGLLMSESRSLYITAAAASMISVLIAAVFPARRAAKYDPVDVIRGAH